MFARPRDRPTTAGVPEAVQAVKIPDPASEIEMWLASVLVKRQKDEKFQIEHWRQIAESRLLQSVMVECCVLGFQKDMVFIVFSIVVKCKLRRKSNMNGYR